MATSAICRSTFSRANVCCACQQLWNIDAFAGSRGEVGRIVTQIRAALARGASHSAGRFKLLPRWADAPTKSVVFGLARNPRLRQLIGTETAQSAFVRRANAAGHPCVHRVRGIKSSPRETTGQCSTWNMPGISETGSNVKTPKKAADRIDFSLTRPEPLGVSDARSGVHRASRTVLFHVEHVRFGISRGATFPLTPQATQAPNPREPRVK